jgi:hypothetical protein
MPNSGQFDTLPSGPNTAVRDSGSQKLPETHQPEVRGPIDWTAYTAYRCYHCRADCLNRIESVYARARECRECFVVPTLDRHSADDLGVDR